MKNRTLIFLALSFTLGSVAIRGEERPNVLVIMADDLGWADIGIQNEEATKDIVTPNIDKLFQSGLRFTNGYVPSSTCGPSRGSFITGRNSSRFGVEGNEAVPPTSEIFLPAALEGTGYKSGLIGKWHLGHEPDELPLARGFDYFFGFLGGNYDYFKSRSTSLFRQEEAVTHDEGYLTDVFAQDAVDFIESNQAEPFFLTVAFNAPHSPMHATQDALERIVAHQPRFEPAYERIKLVEGRDALPHFRFSEFRSKDADPEIMRLVYCAMVLSMDDGVGRIMEKLEELGLRENTAIFFLSDNGAALARPTDFGGVNLPLRYGKGTVFEGGVRVVFGASWPGTIPAGHDYDRVVNSVDLFTTTIELAGGAVPDDRIIDGVNLMPYLTGERQGDPHEAFFFRRKNRNSWSFRSGDFKLVKDRRADRRRVMMYDVSEDVGELVDVSDQYPEKKKELVKLYEKMTKDLPDPITEAAKGKH